MVKRPDPRPRHPIRKLFVEGAAKDNQALKTECREGFRKLLIKAGFGGRMPSIIACGGRGTAYDQFRTAVEDLQDGDVAVLLVDSEAPIEKGTSPWAYVKQRKNGGWDRPDGATDDHLHFMVQCMESWFLADRAALRAFFGNGFREKALPAATAKIEDVSKTDVYDKLAAATSDTKTKGAYDERSKGGLSFKLLAQLDPGMVRKSGFWAERFFSTLERFLNAPATNPTARPERGGADSAAKDVPGAP